MTLFAAIPGSTISLSGSAVSSNAPVGGWPITGPFQVRVYNPGSVIAYVRFSGPRDGAPSAVVATAADIPVGPGQTAGFTLTNPQSGSQPFIAVIVPGGTASLQVSSGNGD